MIINLEEQWLPIEEDLDWDDNESWSEKPGTSLHNSKVRFMVSRTAFTCYPNIISGENFLTKKLDEKESIYFHSHIFLATKQYSGNQEKEKIG